MKVVPTIVIGQPQAIDLSQPKKRSIDRSKPKVRLDGSPDPTCITCQKKNKSTP